MFWIVLHAGSYFGAFKSREDAEEWAKPLNPAFVSIWSVKEIG